MSREDTSVRHVKGFRSMAFTHFEIRYNNKAYFTVWVTMGNNYGYGTMGNN